MKMNWKVLLFVTMFAIAISACNFSTFGDFESVSTSFVGAKQAQKGDKDAVAGPSWSNMDWAILVDQTLIPDDNGPLPVPVISYSAGTIVLRHAEVSAYSNLNWFNMDGSAADPSNFVQGTEYYFRKTDVNTDAQFYLSYVP